MDLSKTIIPKSDQLNADDLIAGPRTIRITAVSTGSAEQPVTINYEGDNGRPYKPSKSMRRILVAVWGKDSRAYIGQSMTLYRDPTIKFGGETVGGIRISHMTGLDKPMQVALTVTRGKRKPYSVEPLTERDWAHEIESATTREELLALHEQAPQKWRDAIVSAGRALQPPSEQVES